MQTYSAMRTLNMSLIRPDSRWNKETKDILKMHSIHVYPAKFPPFIAKEAFNYASEEGLSYKTVADVFCGCGTVALEAKQRGLPFWGCDINPVAVLITKAKMNEYESEKLIRVCSTNQKHNKFNV